MLCDALACGPGLAYLDAVMDGLAVILACALRESGILQTDKRPAIREAAGIVACKTWVSHILPQ